MNEEIVEYKKFQHRFQDPSEVWPLFVRPKYDEIFSSWLFRNASAHFYKPQTFTHLNWPYLSIWNKEVDRNAPESLINSIAFKTNCSIEDVRKTLLTSYIPNLFLEHKPKGITKWLLPTGIYHRTRKRFGLMFCPKCLSKEESKYFKKQWRLSFIVCCTECKIKLHDRCPNCGSPINFIRTGIDQRIKIFTGELSNCYNCSFDLTRSPIIEADSKIVYYQSYLYNSILKGSNDIVGYSHLYFYGLNALILMFLSKEKRTLPFRKYVLQEFNLGSNLSFPTLPFDYLSINYRYSIMLIVSILMEDWPNNFIKFCLQTGVKSSGMLKDKKDFPYWYYKVVKENFYFFPYQKIMKSNRADLTIN